ncbi:MAG: response regulator transcription factor [Lyngbya sp. HA4199-MV5]|jgi:DNA-binding NarL/FixJ family response regulator|nr:response regulator transcription factor [Lyngbya sp. HA4199-MV5]
MIKLLLADDQVLFRQGLAVLLALETDLEIVGEASNGRESVALADQLQPDVILMDVRMPIADGVSATREIHQRHPHIRILVLTTFDEDEYVFKALQVGAAGYLLKNTPSEQLAAAIRLVHQGYSQLGPTIAPKVFAQLQPPSSEAKQAVSLLLSDREQTVLKLLGEGNSNREIAQRLHLTEGTVKNHITRILCQLGVRDRVQAALWAQQHLR